MEIERKFLVEKIDFCLDEFQKHEISQAYINDNPAIRIRQMDNDFFLTIKSKGFLAVEEFEIPIDLAAYNKLMKKTEGNVITKTRYRIPVFGGYTAELDVYKGVYSPLLTVEVEFETVEQALAFTPPQWFSTEVTHKKRYKNSALAFEGPITNK